jgi:hypothetical protein
MVRRRRRSLSAISTVKLNRLLGLHSPPIEQVFYLRPYPVILLGGLILRQASCLDAFSTYPCRTLATQHCRWRDN